LTVSNLENAIEFVKSRLELEVGLRLKTDLNSADFDLQYETRVDRKKGKINLDVKIKKK